MLRKAFITFTDKNNNVIKRTYPQQWKKPFNSVDQHAYEVIEYVDQFDVKSEATNQLHVAPANHHGLELKIAVDNSAITFLNDMLDPANRQIACVNVSFYSAGSANLNDPTKPATQDYTATYTQPQLKNYKLKYVATTPDEQAERNIVDLTVLASNVQYKWNAGNLEATYGAAS
jgi:hypothetical protein